MQTPELENPQLRKHREKQEKRRSRRQREDILDYKKETLKTAMMSSLLFSPELVAIAKGVMKLYRNIHERWSRRPHRVGPNLTVYPEGYKPEKEISDTPPHPNNPQ